MLKNDFVVFYSDIKKILLKLKINSVFLDNYSIYYFKVVPNLNIIKPFLEQESFFVGLNSIISLLNCRKKNLVGKIFRQPKLKPNRADLKRFSKSQYAITHQLSNSKNIKFSAICVLFSNLNMFRYIRYITILVLVRLVSCLGYLVIVSDFCR